MECGEQGRGGERGAAVQVGKYRDRLHLKPPGRFVRTPHLLIGLRWQVWIVCEKILSDLALKVGDYVDSSEC